MLMEQIKALIEYTTPRMEKYKNGRKKELAVLHHLEQLHPDFIISVGRCPHTGGVMIGLRHPLGGVTITHSFESTEWVEFSTGFICMSIASWCNDIVEHHRPRQRPVRDVFGKVLWMR